MDFGIFGFSPEQVQEIRTLIANQQQGQGGNNQSTPANGNAGAGGNEQQQHQSQGGNGDGSNQSEPVLMHTAQHNGVICDSCNTEIRGFRYKCMQCPDFDLCSKCEQKGHHAGHIMMRISFPEQARDAIRRYLSNGSASPPLHPRGPHGHHGHHHGHGPHARHSEHGPRPSWFPTAAGIGTEEPRRGCRRSQSMNEESERPTFGAAAGCPYTMGKKEFKKWSKWMKRAAAHQTRSAAAYARAAAASGNATAGAANAENDSDTEFSPMDFAAVASQIQEFLNYWGIPVDVVELYYQFGNRGQPGAGQAPNQASGTPTQQNEANAPAATPGSGNQENENSAAADTQEQQPASPGAANLSDNMQQMRINDSQNVATAPADVSLLMDLDGENDNNGWTILNSSREQTPGNSNDGVQQTIIAAPAPEQTSQIPVQPTSAAGSINSNNGNDSTPFASAGSSASGEQPAPAPSAPAPRFPSGVPNVPLYPILNPPQIQQILQGVSSAVGSVVRSIPIVTDPRGPVGTTVTNSTPAQVPSTVPDGPAPDAGSNPANVQLDGRSMRTLNQLLAMGFSNEGGYLTRLVMAKNGDLEAVLSSLFPN